jgi:hypothetical protein
MNAFALARKPNAHARSTHSLIPFFILENAPEFLTAFSDTAPFLWN